MSLFVWYFGTNRKFDDCQHHTMVLGPRYEDLLNDIFKRKISCSMISRSTCTGPPPMTHRWHRRGVTPFTFSRRSRI
jgi:hypothetical protein